MTQVRSNAGSSVGGSQPIGPYERLQAEVHEWDPRTADVAKRVAELVEAQRPDLTVEHIGSTAVPGLPGKGIVDLSIETDPADIPAVVAMLYELGFGPQPGPDPWPPTRPMPVGSIDLDGRHYRIHLHVQPRGGDFQRDLAFRDALRTDPELRRQYEGLKRGITDAGPVEGLRYTHSKTAWILQVYRRLGFAPPPIAPPATIGIIGGGQLGRMLALAARDLGYRIVILDPDADAPAGALADRVEVGSYDDVGAALRMAEGCSVITYELEHVGPAVIAALDDRRRPIRPGPYPLKLTADRLAERRFVEANEGRVATWRAVSSAADVLEGAAELGYPVRLKAARGGYDGRSQIRLEGTAGIGDVDGRFGWPSLLEQELVFETELSVVVVRNVDGISRTFPVARNRHDGGILVETVVPAGVSEEVERAAADLAESLATSMGLVGTLTVELFLLSDGSLIVNELAPRVHNSGHWSIEGAVTSQFEQHLRAICGLPLGAVEMRAPAVAMVNLLGEGAPRPAHPTGIYEALEVADAHVHLYDKASVFERRKMGHVTALGASAEEALAKAREAAGRIAWSE
ncbi:MAG TPA: 5-(carboxyamino)imidazole ribonucleotide synthase [Candidatus Limnocylindrales bacterium]|nr:5-(carboxyamino)imidazole ribonucleotide synthase [Candidatus Limnocylindrales bacterium]